MTRDEKLDWLYRLRNEICVYMPKEWVEPMNNALDMAIKALERKPYEKFKSAKDHIYKLAGDYKCWDNRLTQDEALELCHILEQEPTLDKIRAKIKDNRDEWIRGQDAEWHTYDRCLQIIDKYKTESEDEE